MNKSPIIGATACQTALGWVAFAWSARGLAAMTLPQPSEAKALGQVPAPDGEGAPPPGLDPAALVDKLRRYFEGEAVTFDEPLDPTVGTPFLRRVWAAAQAIPRGETRTYGDLARRAGSPHAARAVGQAMARNPWPIVVPCHRVVGSTGSLTGFAGGLAMKRQMLELEGAFGDAET